MDYDSVDPDNIFLEKINIGEITDNNMQDEVVDYLKKVKKHRNIELPKDSIIRSYYK